METLAGHGVDYLFGNPGTTESPIIGSLQDYPHIRYIMALHEGVALGAASYYAQASGRVGVVNLHVAPGLGNALGMLYNALKAGSPLVVTAGQQDTRLRLREPLLGHDLVAMAAPVTKWSKAQHGRVSAALRNPGGSAVCPHGPDEAGDFVRRHRTGHGRPGHAGDTTRRPGACARERTGRRRSLFARRGDRGETMTSHRADWRNRP
jgi:hypothetical protein